MLIYIITFSISLIFIFLSDRSSKLGKNGKEISAKVIYCLLVFIAILLPSLLAGFRDYSVGTDVLIYGNTWFNNAIKTPNFFVYTKWATSSSVGFLYATFNYIISLFTNNPHYFYFWYSFVESLIIYLALKKNKDILDITLGFAIYLFMFFNLTLNILRQSMALVILFYGFIYIRKHKPIKFVIVTLVASLFHNTALIGMILYLIYIFVNKKPKFLYQITTIFITLLFVMFFDEFQGILLGNDIISQRYNIYMNNNALSGGGFYTHIVLMCLPTLLLYLLSKSNDNNIFTGLKMFVVISTILSLLNLKMAVLSRITQYFDIFFIYALAFIIKNGVQLKLKTVSLNKVLLFIYLVIYWVIIYGVMKSGETVPYVFMMY